MKVDRLITQHRLSPHVLLAPRRTGNVLPSLTGEDAGRAAMAWTVLWQGWTDFKRMGTPLPPEWPALVSDHTVRTASTRENCCRRNRANFLQHLQHNVTHGTGADRSQFYIYLKGRYAREMEHFLTRSVPLILSIFDPR